MSVFLFFIQAKKRCKALVFILLKGYQKIISPLLPKTCRYYPSCSEYAYWRLKNQSLLSACYFILLRLLRCNQFSNGGIDYPIVRKKIVPKFYPPFRVVFWLVPLPDYFC